MNQTLATHSSQFFTATIYKWPWFAWCRWPEARNFIKTTTFIIPCK